jgi:hypothetical protein
LEHFSGVEISLCIGYIVPEKPLDLGNLADNPLFVTGKERFVFGVKNRMNAGNGKSC